MEQTQLRRKLKDYYNRIGEPRASWVAKDRCSQIRIHITTDLLKSKLKHNDLVIDVGCGSGEVFTNIRKLRVGTYLVGLDISRGAVKIARKYADDVIVSDVELVPLKNDIANVIMCLAVLEHLVNPERCLREISRISKEKCYVVLQVPNNDSLLLKVRLARTDPEHLHSFTTKGLKKMLEDRGIHPARIFSDAITTLLFLKFLEINLLKFKPSLGNNIFVEALVKKSSQ